MERRRQMRLIDADELINYLGFENTQVEREENIGEIITLEMIDEQPIAYDLDKTIIELGKELKLAEMDKEMTMIENPLQFDYARGYAMGVSNALEIVKGGAE